MARGRIIVVTGGGTGLGRAIARRLAAAGDVPVLMGRRLEKVQAVADEIGGGALALACDVSDPASVASAFAALAARHPRIDGLINNAAVYRPFKVVDASDAEIRDPLMTNVAGTVHCARAAIPMMERGAFIINIGSETVASRVAMFSLYQASKAGLERFTRALREELQPEGIRVTLVRACKMFDGDFEWNVAPERMAQFAEENARRGINQREAAIASFDSAAAQVVWMANLPADVSVPELFLEARFA